MKPKPDTGKNPNSIEEYQPDHPIKFPHSKHAAIEGIDCKYCHSHAEKTSAGLPSVKICLDCHKTTKGNELKENYTRKNGVVWRKVENMDDSVYTNKMNNTTSPDHAEDGKYCIYIQNGRKLPKSDSVLLNYECSKCHY